MKGAGGTSGGIGLFFGGAAMVIAGGYLLLTRVSVSSGGWLFYGYNAFGLSLFPLLIGIGLLFYDGRSIAQTDPRSAVMLLKLAWRYGFRTAGEQMFVRISSNRPWAEIRDDPLVTGILARLQPHGL